MKYTEMYYTEMFCTEKSYEMYLKYTAFLIHLVIYPAKELSKMSSRVINSIFLFPFYFWGYK